MYHYWFAVGFDKLLEECEKKIENDKSLIKRELRGKNYIRPPLSPPKTLEVSIGSVAYFGKSYPSSTKESILIKIRGRFLHKVYFILINKTLELIHSPSHSISDLANIYDKLMLIRDAVLDIDEILRNDSFLKSDTESDIRSIVGGVTLTIHENGGEYSSEFKKLIKDMKNLWNYEAQLLSSRINFHLSNSHKPDVGNLQMNKQDLVNNALPFLIEQEIDGSKLGLSGRSKLDIFINQPRRVIVEIKTGEEDFENDSLQVAGYALARESQFDQDNIDIGCVMYVKLDDRINIPLIKCKTFVIDNELRTRFLLKRDKLMETRSP